MKQFTLTIKEIRHETNDTVTLCFNQPGIRKVKYLAGQYLTLVFRIKGRKYSRPYSFSSSPSTDALLEVTVKKVPKGIVSNYINDHVRIGDAIEVMEPMGDFLFEPTETTKDVFLWGVGSGITPLYSLAKEMLASETNVKVNLVYGNKSKESTIFYETLQQLKCDYPNTFNVIFFYSLIKPIGEVNYYKGRINKEFILSLLSNYQNLNSCIHYICGPENLKNLIKETLVETRTPINAIYTEDFQLLKDPKDFEDIQTQTVTIKFNGQTINLRVIKGQSILEAALNLGIELPYSCQTGNCSTCKGYLKNGAVKMIGLTKKREDLIDNEFLLCCSYPLTDAVFIEI